MPGLNGIIANQFSGQKFYEGALTEIVRNINYLRTAGGYHTSIFEGVPVVEWTGTVSPSTQALMGLCTTSDNEIFALIGTQTGSAITQTALDVRIFDINGNLLRSVSIPFGTGSTQAKSVTDFCVDAAGLMHLYNAHTGEVRVFNQSGTHQFTYGPGTLFGSCIAYNPDNDRVYVADDAGTVYCYAATTGTLLFSRNVYAIDAGGAGPVIKMRSVSFALSNNAVWYDYINKKVWIHDADLTTLVTSWTILSASSGHGDGAPNTRLVVDFANQVYFGTDTNYIVRCNLNGTYAASFGGTGASTLGLFTLVGYINVLTNGQLVIGDVTEDTITRFRASIVYLDIEWFALRKYSATSECAVTPANRIVPWGYNADGVLVPTTGVMNVPIPPTILTSGQYQAPLHVLVIRDLRQYCDQMAYERQLVNINNNEVLCRDWSTANDGYYAAIGSNTDWLEAVQGTKQYSWQRTLGKIAALRPNPADFIELILFSRFLRNCAWAQIA